MIHKTKLAIRIPSEIKDRVKVEAKRRYTSESLIVREAILAYLPLVEQAEPQMNNNNK